MIRVFDLDGGEILHLGESRTDEEYFVERKDDTITVDAVEDALYDVQDFVEVKLLVLGCGSRERNHIRLAVEEIFINICTYAYENGIGRARICCQISGDKASVAIWFIDSGNPFNPLEYETDTSDTHFLEHEGGFGIHLVKNLMDKVEYEYKDGRNILLIEKTLSKDSA